MFRQFRHAALIVFSIPILSGATCGTTIAPSKWDGSWTLRLTDAAPDAYVCVTVQGGVIVAGYAACETPLNVTASDTITEEQDGTVHGYFAFTHNAIATQWWFTLQPDVICLVGTSSTVIDGKLEQHAARMCAN